MANPVSYGMKLPNKTLERKLFADGYRQVIGVDEVGMACLAGPVVVCAIMFTERFFKTNHRKLQGIKDSKLLSANQREEFYKELLEEPEIKYQLASCSPKIIDKINIYQAARLAMRKAITKLRPPLKSIVLMDGTGRIDGIKLKQIAIVKGDRKIFAIACASIIAKVTRDRSMTKLSKKYPQYGLEQHKGYPTKLHRTMLARHGVCPIHRKSFAPVAKLL